MGAHAQRAAVHSQMQPSPPRSSSPEATKCCCCCKQQQQQPIRSKQQQPQRQKQRSSSCLACALAARSSPASCQRPIKKPIAAAQQVAACAALRAQANRAKSAVRTRRIKQKQQQQQQDQEQEDKCVACEETSANQTRHKSALDVAAAAGCCTGAIDCCVGRRVTRAPRARSIGPEECAKCQLIARWTSAQAAATAAAAAAKTKMLAACEQRARRPRECATSAALRRTRSFHSIDDDDDDADDDIDDGVSSSEEKENSVAGVKLIEFKTQADTLNVAAKAAAAAAAPAASTNQHKPAARKRRPAPLPPPMQRDKRQERNLLDETEVYAIEHCLKSHKSAVYVCGCMANLYFTSTQLVDNGRTSAPINSGDNWQLNKTGVPVLTFDSGLTRNRDKRRLNINLTERGSGFVLWSDIIDHLSNYRAYGAQVHGAAAAAASAQQCLPNTLAATTTTCDTFHVMYLSSNHRVMVGLSFDDAQCARLFLRQVELVTSDPANIALTGPKLAACRIAGRLPRLFKSDNNNNSKQQSGLVASPASNCSDTATAHTSWSTLRRAMRFGATRRASSSAADSPPPPPPPLFALRPKPLASLALAGAKSYSKSKRMPRKCDISAPCLFQHVTRVDLSNIDQLYTKSLLANGHVGPQHSEETYELRRRQQQQQQQQQQHLSCSDATSAASSCSTAQQLDKNQQQHTKTNNISSLISSSQHSTSTSCYSSASHSPASSECGAPHAPPSQPKQLQNTCIVTTNAVGKRQQQQQQRKRPAVGPPKPPQRTSSVASSGASAVAAVAAVAAKQQQQQSTFVAATKTEPPKEEQKQQQQQQQEQPDTKINAIIRELQTHASADLVDAKRKLMVDIAHRVAARGTRMAANAVDSPQATVSRL